MIICKNETFNFPFLLYRVIQNSATRYTKTLLIKFLVFIPKLYSALKICLWKSLQSESVKRGHSLYRGSNPEGGGGIMPPPPRLEQCGTNKILSPHIFCNITRIYSNRNKFTFLPSTSHNRLPRLPTHVQEIQLQEYKGRAICCSKHFTLNVKIPTNIFCVK